MNETSGNVVDDDENDDNDGDDDGEVGDVDSDRGDEEEDNVHNVDDNDSRQEEEWGEDPNINMDVDRISMEGTSGFCGHPGFA